MNVRFRHLYSRLPRKANLKPKFSPHTIKRGKTSNFQFQAETSLSQPRLTTKTTVTSSHQIKNTLHTISIHPRLHHSYEENGEIPQLKPSQQGEAGFGKYEAGVLELATSDGTPLWDRRRVPLELIGTRGNIETVFMPNIWLRDNCPCGECINGDTMQRAVDIFSLPEDIHPSKVVTAKGGLQITWQDGHQSLYPWNWIISHKNQAHKSNEPKRIEESQEYWGAEIADNPPSVHYDEIMANDAGVGAWTEKIRKYGFCYVDGCPIDPSKTEELLRRITFIRETHYGGFYDFTSDLTMKDTAYTSLALPAHTDTTYFTEPAGLQMFHLLSHTSGEGGKSLLVDGFKAVRILQKEDSEAHKTLRSFKLSAHASGNEGITITPANFFTVLEYLSGDKTEDITRIRWNNDDRVTIPLNSGTVKWYEAARKFNEILKRKDIEYWAQLKPGRPLIFDNWRVLHGRSVFTGKRRICGGYINYDDYISRWRNTNFTRSEALQQIL